MAPKMAGPSGRRSRAVARPLVASLQAKGEAHAWSVVLRTAWLLGLEVAGNPSAG